MLHDPNLQPVARSQIKRLAILCDDDSLTFPAKMVLMALASNVQDGGKNKIDFDRLMRMTRLSRRAVYGGLKVLKDLGITSKRGSDYTLNPKRLDDLTSKKPLILIDALEQIENLATLVESAHGLAVLIAARSFTKEVKRGDLVAVTATSDRTVKRELARLEAAGLISVKRQVGRKGGLIFGTTKNGPYVHNSENKRGHTCTEKGPYVHEKGARDAHIIPIRNPYKNPCSEVAACGQPENHEVLGQAPGPGMGDEVTDDDLTAVRGKVAELIRTSTGMSAVSRSDEAEKLGEALWRALGEKQPDDANDKVRLAVLRRMKKLSGFQRSTYSEICDRVHRDAQIPIPCSNGKAWMMPSSRSDYERMAA